MPTWRELKDTILTHAAQPSGGSIEDAINVMGNAVYRDVLDAGHVAHEEREFTFTTVAAKKQYGMPLYAKEVKSIVDPDNEPSKSDSKKVQKEKREKQYTKALYLHNTFNSFKAKTGYKDIVGLGNFVESLSHKAEVEIEPENRAAFKTLIKEYYNINLDAKEEFMLPGYSLKEGTVVKRTPLKPIVEHSAEEVIALMWERSNLSREEFMEDEARMTRIQEIYADIYPKMSDDEIWNNKMFRDAMNLDVSELKAGKGINFNRYANLTKNDPDSNNQQYLVSL